jgi:DNA modification methylase
MRTLPDKSVHCVITSPPYFGLRDYGHDGQIGLEQTPDEYVAKLVEIFREARRVLRDDGTLWLNLGDSYSGSGPSGASYQCKTTMGRQGKDRDGSFRISKRLEPRGLTYAEKKPIPAAGTKAKDLIGIPWRVAFALQADGWYLRQDIIWSKPNPMPESVRDRCTKAHEYLFLLTKSPRYYFDADAIKEPAAASSVARLAQNVEAQKGSDRVPGKTNGPMKAVRSAANSFKREGSKREQAIPGQSVGTHRPDRKESDYDIDKRNKRSVWNVSTKPFKGAHFATFPPELVEPCILASCPKGGVVLDPFGGSGTTGGVALAHGRRSILCELNPEYAALVTQRVAAIVKKLRRSDCA